MGDNYSLICFIYHASSFIYNVISILNLHIKISLCIFWTVKIDEGFKMTGVDLVGSNGEWIFFLTVCLILSEGIEQLPEACKYWTSGSEC